MVTTICPNLCNHVPPLSWRQVNPIIIILEEIVKIMTTLPTDISHRRDALEVMYRLLQYLFSSMGY